MSKFTCVYCSQTKPVQTNGGTGYAKSDKGKICYDCCALEDTRWMETNDRTTLYFAEGIVCNWPGTLKIKPEKVRKGRHNIAREQVMVWFRHAGKNWLGRNIGDNQILRCRAIK